MKSVTSSDPKYKNKLFFKFIKNLSNDSNL
jgi:hypothetical protein